MHIIDSTDFSLTLEMTEAILFYNKQIRRSKQVKFLFNRALKRRC